MKSKTKSPQASPGLHQKLVKVKCIHNCEVVHTIDGKRYAFAPGQEADVSETVSKELLALQYESGGCCGGVPRQMYKYFTVEA